jgi:glycosyltransferase 2 family protein
MVATEKNKGKSLLLTLLKLAVGVAALALLFVWVDWRQALAVLVTANPGWLALGGIIILLVWSLDALRLHWMTPIDGLAYRTHLALALQSAFVMQFGFGVFSGDGYRVAGYALKSGKVFKPTAHLVASRIAGFSSVALMAVIVSLWVMLQGDAAFLDAGKSIIKSVSVVGIFAFAVLLFLWLIFRGRQLPRWMDEARAAMKTITLRIWLLSIIMVLLRGVSFACILYGLDIHVQFYVPLLANISATLTALLPVLGGIGVKEGAYVGITSLFGITAAIGLSAALLMRFVVLLATSFGLLLSLGLSTGKPKNIVS